MRRRIIILIPAVSAIVILLFLLDFLVLASPAQMEMQLREQLKKQLAADVEFDLIKRHFFSTQVEIDNIRLTSLSGKKEEFLRADKMEVRLNPLAVFGAPPIKKIKLISPVLSLVRDDEGQWNFPLTAREDTEDPLKSMMRPPSATPMPKIDLDNARIDIRNEATGEEDSFDGLNFTVEMGGQEESRSLSMAYFFEPEANNGRHLQLTFTIPNNGEGMSVTTSGEGPNHLVLNENMRKLLTHLSRENILFAQDLLKHWDSLNLQGAIRVDSFRLHQYPKAPPGEQWRAAGSFFLEDCSLEHDEVPYPARGITGRLLLDGKNIELVNVTGLSPDGRGRITVDGRIFNGEYNLKLVCKNISIDETVRGALPKGILKIADHYIYRPEQGPWNSGYADLTCSLKSQNGKPVSHVTLDIRQGKAWMSYFPYLITDIEGRLVIDGYEVTIANMKGRHGKGEVRVSDGVANWGKIDIDVHAKNVLMEPAFGNALQGNFRAAYNRLNPSGTVDFAVRVRQDSLDEPIHVVADIASDKTLSFKYDGLPLSVEAVTTDFTVYEEKLVVRKFAGNIGGATIAMNDANKGVYEFGKSSSAASFSIKKIEGLTLNSSNVSALPGGMGKTLATLKTGGRVDIEDLDMRYTQNGEETTYSFSLRIHCHDVSFGKRGFLSKMNGVVDLTVQDKGNGAVSVEGEIKNFDFAVLGIKANITKGEITPVSTNNSKEENSNPHMLSFAGNMHGRADKSNLFGSLTFNLGEGREYKGEIKVMGADIKAILTDLGQDAATVKGRLGGYLNISGEGEDMSKLKGEGLLRFTKANLIELPIILALKSLLKGRPPTAQVINRGEVHLELRDSAFELDKILLKSDALTIAGHGSIDFNGDTDVTLYSDTILDGIPVVDALMRLISKKIYAVTIQGKFMEPKIGPASIGQRVISIPEDILEMLKDLPGVDIGGD